MATVSVSTQVRAPLENVFRGFADLENAAARVQNIRDIQVLTQGDMKLGTRWRETRVIAGQQASEDLEITAFEWLRSYTITADRLGTRVDCTFRFAPVEDGTAVTVDLDVIPQSFAARIAAPFGAVLLSTIQQMLEQDLADLRTAIERDAKAAQPL